LDRNKNAIPKPFALAAHQRLVLNLKIQTYSPKRSKSSRLDSWNLNNQRPTQREAPAPPKPTPKQNKKHRPGNQTQDNNPQTRTRTAATN